MRQRLTTRRRWIYALGAIAALTAMVTLAMIGFALTSLWPGVSLALGGGMALVAVVLAYRWLRAALTGRSPRDEAEPLGHHGTL
jgi:hypothetical protein